MITDFKEELDISQEFINYVLNWIKRNYNSIQNIKDL